MRRLLTVLAATSAVIVGTIAAPGASAVGLPLTEIAATHTFVRPLYLTNAGDARLFVVEQGGLIKIIHPDESVTTFLDVSSHISTDGPERGLLGLAFDPNYAANGLLYVNYTRAGDGDTVVAEYRRSASNPDVADPASWRRVLRIDQPASNHNGGWMGFRDGLLYVATGDGGGSPAGRSQSLNTLLGKILRINPHDPPGAARYSIPSDNPVVGRTGRDEIWSRGLRNPWRCSFDRLTEDMWCGDVGQNQWEEINHSITGRRVNYGWALLEGTHLYPSGDPCTTRCKTRPILEYSHTYNAGPCGSVTGGYVARRPGAALEGEYIFGDYCSGKVWIIPEDHALADGLPAPVADTTYHISSWGEDVDGYLYLVNLDGAIYRLDES